MLAVHVLLLPGGHEVALRDDAEGLGLPEGVSNRGLGRIGVPVDVGLRQVVPR